MAEKDAEATKTQPGEDGESFKNTKEQIKLESEDPGPGHKITVLLSRSCSNSIQGLELKQTKVTETRGECRNSKENLTSGLFNPEPRMM